MLLDIKILQRLRENDSTLKSLNLQSKWISDGEAKELRQALLQNTTLITLNLGNNEISDTGATALGQALQNGTLKLLNLENNKISDEGATALGQALQQNSTLTLLDLRYNYICDKGVKELGQALRQNTTLKRLNLRSNWISDEGVKALGRALLQNTTLITLNLAGNLISDAVKTQIDSLIKRNQEYLKELQSIALTQLIFGRAILRERSLVNKDNPLLALPLEIRERIVRVTDKEALMTEEQKRLILNYAEGKIAPVADKLSFFKVTKCDRIRKQLNQDEAEAASRPHSSMD